MNKTLTRVWRSTLAAVVVVSIAGPAVFGQQAPNLGKGKPNTPAPAAKTKTPAATDGQPKAVCEAPVKDFGEVWTGPNLEHAFTITNNGTGTLEILQVRPGCGCTTAGAYPKKLTAGQSGQFPFKLDSKKLRGPFNKNIRVTTNDPSNPTMTLKLSGQCKQYVDVNPRNAYFPKVYGAEPQEKVLKITNNTETPLELNFDEMAKDSAFKYELVTLTEGKQYELKIRVEPPFTPGNAKERLKIKTNIPQQSELDLLLSAVFPKRLDVRPSPLYLMAAPRETTRMLLFTNSGDKPVAVTEAKVDDDQLEVDVMPRRDGEQYSITVKAPANYNLPNSGRTLTILTDDPSEPMMKVPLLSRSRPTQQRKRPQEEMKGKAMPSFELQMIGGTKVASSTMASQVTVLNFVAPNCGFCKKQLPELEKIRRSYEAKGVKFVTVSQKMGKRAFTEEESEGVMRRYGYNGPLAINHDNSVGQMFKARSYPSLFVIGQDGKVASVHVGFRQTTFGPQLTGSLDKLIAGGTASPAPQPKGLSAAPAKKRTP